MVGCWCMPRAQMMASQVTVAGTVGKVAGVSPCRLPLLSGDLMDHYYVCRELGAGIEDNRAASRARMTGSR